MGKRSFFAQMRGGIEESDSVLTFHPIYPRKLLYEFYTRQCGGYYPPADVGFIVYVLARLLLLTLAIVLLRC